MGEIKGMPAATKKEIVVVCHCNDTVAFMFQPIDFANDSVSMTVLTSVERVKV